MSDSDLLYGMVITGLIVFGFTLIIISLIYEERIDNIEYDIAFMKLDLSCDKKPYENIMSNYLLPLKHDELIERVNSWYLESCV